MIFRQLFESDSSTYTYLLGCPETGMAVLIDPVLETAERDLDAVQALGLTLAWTVETHVHADHVTAAARLRALSGCRIAFPAGEEIAGADAYLSELRGLEIGAIALKPLYTPGHTDHHHSYLVDGRVFTGDALLIDGCGRTDFQGGCAATLYRSVHDKIFSLPDETLVYPAHDYRGREVSSVGKERARNPRLGGGRSAQEFVAIMADLGLPYPKKIDIAVPANRRCGELADGTVPG
ncbi:MAG: sulfur dioxygenase [Sphingomonadales bacterium]|jgi:glyoxylase-like metal-dependent hydrolase (beta-lactamase superfamily II)|nr:sulfur dioxygenase [Sphingomonadales bacterium]MEA3044873.1 sulfur dioxygenase [Sphingomonadales bacterium]